MSVSCLECVLVKTVSFSRKKEKEEEGEEREDK
jgi:hypothetical protein